MRILHVWLCLGVIVDKLTAGSQLGTTVPKKTRASFSQIYYLFVWPISCLRHSIVWLYPWINENLRSIMNFDSKLFLLATLYLTFYRNIVNGQRKICRANFYISKTDNLKQLSPKNWWHEVKRLSGMDENMNIISSFLSENAEHLSSKELAS